MTGVPNYYQVSQHLMNQAEFELEAGDTPQTSEKAWGAAAQVVKACASERGLEHGSHASLFVAVDGLAEETHDRELRALFRRASGLHQNFYEGVADYTHVRDGVQDVRRFIGRVEATLRRI